MNTSENGEKCNSETGKCGSRAARVSATMQVFHVRGILDGATCRLRELGDVLDVRSVLGVAFGVPILLRVLVSQKEERMRKMKCSW